MTGTGKHSREAAKDSMAENGRTQHEIILEALEARPLSRYEIASLIGTNPLAAMRPIAQLREAGRVRVTGNGDYELIPDFGGAA